MWEELKHNLKKGFFINLILAVQFAVLFWQGTNIASYFLDLPTTFSTENIRGDSAYYSLHYWMGSEEDYQYAGNVSENPDYESNQIQVLAELRSNPEYHYMAFDGTQGLIAYEELEGRFSQQDLLDFYAGSEYPGSFRPEETPPDSLTFSMSGMNLLEVNCFSIDQAAMEEYRFQVSDGQLFGEEDFLYRWDQEEIPVLLGHAYGSGFQPGDVIRGFTYSIPCRFRVVGILEKGTAYISDMFADNAEPASLDYSMIVPYVLLEEPPRNYEEEGFSEFNNSKALEGIIVVDADTPRSEVNAIARKISNLYVEHGLYPLFTSEAPSGMMVFKTESETTMQILLGASVIMGVISIAGICMSIISKLNRNLQRYGIEIMNGQNPNCILGAFLLEILLVIAAGLIFNLWWYRIEISVNRNFYLVIFGLALICVGITSAIFIRRLRKVDIEEILRSEE